VRVNNVAPTIVIAPDQPTTVVKNTPFSVTFTIEDPGVNDGWTYQITWGDKRCGTTTVPGITSLGTYKATCSSGYTTPGGPYTLSVRVTDSDGGTTLRSIAVTVTK
jgi:hypothetical protein